jgi:hypothetical protein
MAAIYGAELAAVVCWVIAWWRLDVSTAARQGIHAGLDASRKLRDPASSDEDKERAARAASAVLFRSLGSIATRSIAALAVAFLPLFLLDFAGVASISAVNQLMLSLNGILFASAAVGLMYLVRSLL